MCFLKFDPASIFPEASICLKGTTFVKIGLQRERFNVHFSYPEIIKSTARQHSQKPREKCIF